MNYKIWFKRYSDDRFVGSGVNLREYKDKAYAKKVAKKTYGKNRSDGTFFVWIVSEDNPF